jgi:hypothetical protein
MPEGSLARLNARFYREREGRARVRSFRWFMIPALSLATLLMVLWIGGDRMHQKAPAPSAPSIVQADGSRTKKTPRRHPELPRAIRSTEPATGSLAAAHEPGSHANIAAQGTADSAASTRLAERRDSDEEFGRSALAYYPGGAVPAPLQ